MSWSEASASITPLMSQRVEPKPTWLVRTPFAAVMPSAVSAKFAAVVALWLGWNHLFDFTVYASLFGGALTLLILSFRRSVLPAFVIRQPWVQRLHDQKAGVPYGVALAAAGLATYPDTVWMRLATG